MCLNYEHHSQQNNNDEVNGQVYERHEDEDGQANHDPIRNEEEHHVSSSSLSNPSNQNDVLQRLERNQELLDKILEKTENCLANSKSLLEAREELKQDEPSQRQARQQRRRNWTLSGSIWHDFLYFGFVLLFSRFIMKLIVSILTTLAELLDEYALKEGFFVTLSLIWTSIAGLFESIRRLQCQV